MLQADRIVELRDAGYKDDSRLPDLFALADNTITDKVSGQAREQAKALFALHYITLADRQSKGSAGNINNISEGDLSIGFQSPSVDNSYNQTSYGLELQDIIEKYIVGVQTRYM